VAIRRAARFYEGLRLGCQAGRIPYEVETGGEGPLTKSTSGVNENGRPVNPARDDDRCRSIISQNVISITYDFAALGAQSNFCKPCRSRFFAAPEKITRLGVLKPCKGLAAKADQCCSSLV